MDHPSYAKLFELSKNCQLLHAVESLLEWDQETYMPQDAIEMRSSQIEMLASLVHKGRTSPQFRKTLDSMIDIETGEIKDDKLSQRQIAALREWRRDYIKAVKLPSPFVKQFARTTSTASHVWKTAKQHNDFRSFAPHLEKVVSLCRKKSEILGFHEHPYDALLDLYEPEMKTSYLTPLFEKLKLHLKELIKEIMAQPTIDDSFLYAHVSKEAQMEFCHAILKKMGFDDDSSRLDVSAHPFCTGLHPKDTRMTTGVHLDNLFFAVFAAMHEGGHGLYNRGLPIDQYGSPLGEQSSLGIDESQSRWWETLIGQSLPFWQHFYPLLQARIPDFKKIDLDDFYRAINVVKPALIRIEADEVTYNLHVIVRFEIEKGLIEGTIKPKDIPAVWNEKMRDNLGIAPEFDSQGCLQDIHWSLGYIGYFPTYTLGNLYSVQFFNTFEKAHSDWRERISNGDLNFVREWLRTNIHQHGRQYTPSELCQKVTGKPLNEMPFVSYLNQKYKALYQI